MSEEENEARSFARRRERGGASAGNAGRPSVWLAGTSPLMAAGWTPKLDDRLLLMKVVLHTCDIGHFASSWETHHDWSLRVRTEFNAQCAQERERGIPVSSFLEARAAPPPLPPPH